MMTTRLLNMRHLEIAYGVLQDHSPAIADGVPLDGLAGDIAEKLQEAFDLGFRAAGGTITDLRADGVSEDGK